MNLKKAIIVLVHAVVGWGICGAIIGIGRNVTTMEITLILHAIGAPVFFAIIALIYFKYFNYTPPLQTAIIFVSFVIFMDVFLVALFIEKSFAMFTSILGTWIPFVLIFMATYITGLYLKSRS